MIRFYAVTGHRFDALLADAFCAGLRRLRLAHEVLPAEDFAAPRRRTRLAVSVGVKGLSRRVFQEHCRYGLPALFLDKGYTRASRNSVDTSYWRASLNDFHPFAYLREQTYPADRWDSLRLAVAEPRGGGEEVLLAGSSLKYSEWFGLSHPTDYAKRVLRQLRQHTDRPLVYRPKPSWKEALPLRGSRFSGPDEYLSDWLPRLWALVTHGSNACFEALLHGVPTIILGDGVTRDLSSRDPADVESPRRPAADEVARLAHGLAYWQWSLEEIERGLLWRHLEPYLER